MVYQSKILLVENESVIASDVHHMLKSLGYVHVTVVYSGREAIRKAREIDPDAILMDIGLGGKIDGIQAAEQIRKKQDVPVIFLTAHSDKRTLQRTKKASPYGYILKPVELRDLNTTLDLALYRHGLESELRKSEQRLHSVFHSTHDVVLILNAQAKITFCNKVAETVLGYTCDELEGRSCSFVIPKRHRPDFNKKVRAVLGGRRSSVHKIPVETKALKKSGLEFPAEVSLARWKMRDEVFCTAFFRDITERSHSERVLKFKIRQLTALSEASQALTASLDLDKVLAQIVTLARKITASKYIRVTLVDNFGQVEKNFENLPKISGKKHRIRKRGLTNWVIKTRKPLIFDEVKADGTFVPPLLGKGAPRTANARLKNAGIQAVAGLPLMAKSNLEGVLFLYSPSAAAFAEQLPLLKAFANQVAIAIENARLYEMVRQELFSRKQTEEALKLERDFAEGLVDTAQTIVLVLDTRGRIVRFNTYMEEISGYKLMEVQGHDWTTIFLQKGARKKNREFFLKAIADGRSRGTNPIYTKKGVARQIEWSNKTLKEKSGKVMGVLAIGQDITERIEMEEHLRLSEERYRTISELTSDFAYAYQVEPNGALKSEWLTGALFRITGYTADKLKEHGGWDSIIYPGDAHIAEDKMKSLLAGYSKVVEYRIITKKEEVKWIRDFAHPVWDKEQGRVTHIHGAVQDITERHTAREALLESEQRFRGIAERSIDAIFALDADGKFTYASPAIKSIGGYKPDEVIGRSYQEIIESDDIPVARAMFDRLANGESVENIELQVVKKSGSAITVEINASPISKNGKMIGFQGMVRDITERKRAMEELHKSREQLRNLAAHYQSVREEERTKIAREIHDELGQALTALKIDLSWLSNRFSEDQESLQKKVKVMNNLIDSSIVTMKRLSTELRPVLLDDIGLEAAVEWYAEEFQKRTGINCSVNFGSEDINLDEKRSIALFRIFQEALTNIARHAKASKVKVLLEKSADEVKLKVNDNGIGIKNEKMAVPNSFGLIGMRERAHYLGGELSIEGKSKKGTTILLRIPFRKGGRSG